MSETRLPAREEWKDSAGTPINSVPSVVFREVELSGRGVLEKRGRGAATGVDLLLPPDHSTTVVVLEIGWLWICGEEASGRFEEEKSERVDLAVAVPSERSEMELL